MNNLDFYKLKYLKYKNKYISLKNKNELELKGGKPPVTGTHLFYIPAIVLTQARISYRKDSHKIFQGPDENFDISFNKLYEMSVLVIPVISDEKSDEKTISSTDEWFIPQINTGWLKNFEPIKWGKKLTQIARKFFIDLKIARQWGEEYALKLNEERKWLYYTAKQFLDAHPHHPRLSNLDVQPVSCLEYEIKPTGPNTFRSWIDVNSFNYYKAEVQENKQTIADNGGIEDLKKVLEQLLEQEKLLEASKEELHKQMGSLWHTCNYKGRNMELAEDAMAAKRKHKELKAHADAKIDKMLLLLRKSDKIKNAITFLEFDSLILNDNKELLQWAQVV